RQSPARAAPCARRMQALESRARIFPDTTRNAAQLAVTASHSPTGRLPQRQDRYRNAVGQRNEFPLIPVPGLGNPLPLPDADLGLEFVLGALSEEHTSELQSPDQ